MTRSGYAQSHENGAGSKRLNLTKTIQVGIVEDEPRIRRSLARLLSQSTGMLCNGTYASAEEALQKIPADPFDVILMDINLPGMSGIECVRKLREALPPLNVIMLTVYEDSERIFQALQAGAHGYLLKRSSQDEIVKAVHEVVRGGAPMSSHIARLVVQSFKNQPPPESAESLTNREQEILQLITGGLANKEIADSLNISVETVRNHLKKIYDKLHVRSRTEAAVKFLRK